MYLSISSRVIVASNFLNSGDKASSASSSSSPPFKVVKDGGARESGRWILPTDDTKATISIP